MRCAARHHEKINPKNSYWRLRQHLFSCEMQNETEELRFLIQFLPPNEEKEQSFLHPLQIYGAWDSSTKEQFGDFLSSIMLDTNTQGTQKSLVLTLHAEENISKSLIEHVENHR